MIHTYHTDFLTKQDRDLSCYFRLQFFSGLAPHHDPLLIPLATCPKGNMVSWSCGFHIEAVRLCLNYHCAKIFSGVLDLNSQPWGLGQKVWQIQFITWWPVNAVQANNYHFLNCAMWALRYLILLKEWDVLTLCWWCHEDRSLIRGLIHLLKQG